MGFQYGGCHFPWADPAPSNTNELFSVIILKLKTKMFSHNMPVSHTTPLKSEFFRPQDVLSEVFQENIQIIVPKFLADCYYTLMGDGAGGHWLVWMEWCPAGWSVFLPLLIFPCIIKSRSSLLAPAHLDGPGKRATKRLWWWCNYTLVYPVGCICQSTA